MNDEERIARLLALIGTDVHAAAELLGVAATYLKAREVMPNALADYIAHAFRDTANTPQPESGRKVEHERIARLTHRLGMTKNEGRPRVNLSHGKAVLAVAAFGERLSETTLKHELAKASGVSESTARSRIKAAKSGVADAKRRIGTLLEDSGLDGSKPLRTS